MAKVRISRTEILRKVQDIEKKVNLALAFVEQLEGDKMKMLVPLKEAQKDLKFIERNI